MDELQIKGKTYISSKRAHATTGYAKDYIGQLARAGKIPATRVGRAWYVDESALRAYGFIEETDASADSALVTASVPATSSAIETARTVLKNRNHSRTIPTIAHAFISSPNHFQKTWSQVRYSPDQKESFPPLVKSSVVSTIEIQKPIKEISAIREDNVLRVRIMQDQRIAHAPIQTKTKPGTDTLKVAAPLPVAVKKSIPKQRQTARRIRVAVPSPYALGLLTIGIFVLAISTSGMFVASHLSYAPASGIYSANAFLGYEYVTDMVSESPFIQNGLQALTGFYNFLSGSFGTLFQSGINFLASLIHLV